MLPYVIVPPLTLGPFVLQPFGILVAIGLVVGWKLAKYRGQQRGLDVAELETLLWWVVVCGFVSAHIAENVAYHPAELVAQPLRLFMLWRGLSSFGGFAGAAFGAYAWKYYRPSRRGGEGSLAALHWPTRRARPMALLPFADVIMSVFPIAWAAGRMGCSLVHDYPGVTAKRSWLSVAYGPGPTHDYGIFQIRFGGMPRYDLGLLELIVTLVIAVAFVLSWRRAKVRGLFVFTFCLAYAPARFLLDYLRAPPKLGGDVRYTGLTPAQWGCLVLFGLGLFLARAANQRTNESLGEHPSRCHDASAGSPLK